MKDQLRYLFALTFSRGNGHKHAAPRGGITDHQNFLVGKAINPLDDVFAGRELPLTDVKLKRYVAPELVVGSLRLAGGRAQCEQENQRYRDEHDFAFDDGSR